MQEILNMSREVHDRSAGRGLVKEAYAGHLVAILAIPHGSGARPIFGVLAPSV
jgi:hypothetical protein